MSNIVVFFAQQPNSAPRRLIVKVSVSHTIRNTHTRDMTPLYERSARRMDRYIYNTQQTQETNIHPLSGIRTRNPSNLVDSDLRIRPRGHRVLANIQLAWS